MLTRMGSISVKKLHSGNENGEHICGENSHGDNLNPHNINKLSCSHKSTQETQHLCLPEICLCSVEPEHQPSKIYESLTGKHIKYYNAGQVSQHPSLPDGNHHMSTFPLLTKCAWIGQGFHSVKEIPNHGHSIYGVDWGAQHSCGEISHGNSTKTHIKSNQHIDTPHAFSNYAKTTLNHGLSLSEVDWGDLKRETTKHRPSLMEVDWGGKLSPTTHQVDASSWKLTGEEKSNPTTHQVDAYSRKLTGEENS